ncbi:hypothetical protein RRG08_057930 [Elysia crispata]|uniref:Uncharacterized protein n=1 Tax=Elysia crispata TaxID=231223 RepID=A0AAE0Y538_9GAST|nr:hypothetical protein RRG08_057930 [Elysia crispata]
MAVAAEARCDLRIDCTDKSDEQNCETCRLELCSDGRCVSQPWLSDGEKDCVSLYGISDPDRDISINGELDCAFLCNRSECVGWGKLGDGVLGCHGPEGPLDETLGALEPVDYRVCDGSTDCPDGSDETGCHVTCAEGFFCVAGFVVADDYDKSELLTDLSLLDLRTRMVDFSHINVSSVLPTMILNLSHNALLETFDTKTLVSCVLT